tara:strand:+ start:6481 stop:7059 length:579 start_codon:yes stop_codon:yes gene_type:complete
MVIKITVIGDINVGKTSVVLRYMKDIFYEYSETTIGASFSAVRLKRNNRVLEIWDTAGQERYNALLPLYYRSSNVIIFMFNLNNNNSFVNLKTEWVKIIDEHNLDPLLILVGNKCDLDQFVDDKQINDFLDEHPTMLYQKVSAKKNIGINELFDKIIHNVKQYGKKNSIKISSPIIKISDDRKCDLGGNMCC